MLLLLFLHILSCMMLPLIRFPFAIASQVNFGKFGESPDIRKLAESRGFITPHAFYHNHVKPNKPIIFRNAFAREPAMHRWRKDRYFYRFNEAYEYLVNVEQAKKEVRKLRSQNLTLIEFLEVYRRKHIYLVDEVPEYLHQDLHLPEPLRVESWRQNFNLFNLWFSSGNTSSVVHTDSFENILCVIVGNKTVVMVDTKRDGDKIKMKQVGTYSELDVDRVDLEKFPGLRDVQFFQTKLIPGDCLYLPYLWIHQVRSQGRNLAVNYWLTHPLSAPQTEQQQPRSYGTNQDTEEKEEEDEDGDDDKHHKTESELTINLSDYKQIDDDWLMNTYLSGESNALHNELQIFKESFGKYFANESSSMNFTEFAAIHLGVEPNKNSLQHEIALKSLLDLFYNFDTNLNDLITGDEIARLNTKVFARARIYLALLRTHLSALDALDF